MSFPRYDTPTGRIVGGPYLGKPEISPCWFPEGANSVDPKIACLYYAADRRAQRDTLINSLNSGENWVLDRYVEANMGHQGGKAAGAVGRRDIVDFIDRLEYGLLGMPRPNKVLLLYMPYQVGMELKKGRAGAADGHESNPEHLQNAEKAYLQIADWRKWQVINCAPTGNIGSLRSKEDIHQEVYSAVKSCLDE
jgi:dTMP kinase